MKNTPWRFDRLTVYKKLFWPIRIQRPWLCGWGVTLLVVGSTVVLVPEIVASTVGLIDEHNGAFTALASFIIALFTGTIWAINRRQLKHSRVTERAYVSGGVFVQSERLYGDRGNLAPAAQLITLPRSLFISVDNHGKTPAFIHKIAVEVCREIELPDVPQYTDKMLVNISVSPGTVGQLTQIEFDYKDVANMVVYGRVYYSDIFDGQHSSGFIRWILGTPTGDAVEAPSAYLEWD